MSFEIKFQHYSDAIMVKFSSTLRREGIGNGHRKRMRERRRMRGGPKSKTKLKKLKNEYNMFYFEFSDNYLKQKFHLEFQRRSR